MRGWNWVAFFCGWVASNAFIHGIRTEYWKLWVDIPLLLLWFLFWYLKETDK